MQQIWRVISSLAGQVSRLVQAYPSAAAYLGGAALVIVSGFIGTIYVRRWQERTRPARIAALKADYDEKRKIHDTPQLHASLLDQKFAAFSLFSILASALGWLRSYAPLQDIALFGVTFEDMALAGAIIFALIALAALLHRWLWTRTFANWDQWEERRRAEIVRLQEKTLSKRRRLNVGNKSDAQLDVDAEEAVSPATSDRFSSFLSPPRKEMPTVLAKGIRDGRNQRPWQIGTVQNAINGRFGFIDERVANASTNLSDLGERFYFNRVSLCSEGFPDTGDDVLFMTSSKKTAANGDREPAYLVCAREKPCQGFVRRVLSRRACLVEIVDGYENYTSVLAVLDSSLLEAGTRLKGGERVEGIVTHNNIGVMLKKLKLVSAA